MLTLLQAVVFSTVIGGRLTWHFEPEHRPVVQPPAWAQIEGGRNEFGAVARHGR